MRIVVAGGHGQVARLLHPLLRAGGHEVRGLIRNSDQISSVRRAGAEPVLCDLEAGDDVASAISAADAIVFAAGAGAGSGAARKLSMDRGGAIRLIEAASRAGIERYIMISAMQAETPRGDEVFRTYLQAKAEADEALRQSGLDYTIVRPGRLSDDPGRGRVRLAAQLPRDEIPRADVAAVVASVLDQPATVGRQFDVTRGEQRIAEAVAAVAHLGSATDLHVSDQWHSVDVPVFGCIVYVSSDDRGGVRARVANLAGLDCTATTEREALAKIVPAFKQRIAELLQSKAAIPWIDPPVLLESDERKRFIPVHL
ncbi:MAG: NAD(P)H-binding protein [Pirellulales bacterium]